MQKPLLGFVDANQKITREEDDSMERSTKKVKDREVKTILTTDRHMWHYESPTRVVDEVSKIIMY